MPISQVRNRARLEQGRLSRARSHALRNEAVLFAALSQQRACFSRAVNARYNIKIEFVLDKGVSSAPGFWRLEEGGETGSYWGSVFSGRRRSDHGTLPIMGYFSLEAGFREPGRVLVGLFHSLK
jgi:hypothetical protein